jgi:polyhydroxybutyrate depolymerase
MRSALLAMSLVSCAVTNLAAGAPERGAIDAGGLRRTYALHVPAKRSSAHAPLVVVLHGHFGTGADALARYGWDELADRKGFVVVAPDGVDRGWNDGRAESDAARALRGQRGVDDVGFVVQLIDALAVSHAIDRERVYVAGMSNGGILAQRLGCARAGRFAGIASVASSMADGDCAPGRAIAVAIVDGTDDRIVPYGGGEVGRGDRGRVRGAAATRDVWRAVDGCTATRAVDLPHRDAGDPTRTTVELATGCARGGAVALVTVAGGGHEWPGARGVELPRLLGRRSRDFAASEAVWRFFAAGDDDARRAAFAQRSDDGARPQGGGR